LTKEHMV